MSPAIITAEEISPRHGQAAGMVSRSAAALVDFGVVWAISALITVSINLIQSVLGSEANAQLSALGVVFAGYTLLFVYLSLCWIVGGRTLGQLLLGLRVRRTDGGRIRFFQAIARGWGASYFALLLFWSIVSRRSAAVWDVVLRTEVVYDWTKAEPHPK